MIQLILVGGPTGIGKSKLIDVLLAENQRFKRPRSYTTRPRRVDETREEYEHVSHDEFKRLEASGIFVTVDEVYGNYYAIAYSSINELNSRGYIAVKEIHPNNHAKIKRLFPGVLSVLIIPENPNEFWSELKTADVVDENRLQRIDKDRELYQAIDPFGYPFDIVIRVRPNVTSLEEQKRRFLQGLALIETAADVNSQTIDETNRRGYNYIASEFSDTKRVTTANFHTLGSRFFETQISKYAAPSTWVLDLGVGTGHLLPLLMIGQHRIIAADLSSRMLSLITNVTERHIKMCCSAFHLPFAEGSIDLVVSSLADPFLHKEALSEVRRVLVKSGRFIFSTPSRIWSDALRDHTEMPKIMTRFSHSSGPQVSVYSFTYTDSMLRELLISSGFDIEKLQVANGSQLLNQHEKISPALTDAAENLGMSLSDLPILQLAVARKLK